MSLSIRTQDRMVLTPYNETIAINGDENGEWYLYIPVEQFMKTLGTYATKERALEVLDEIERHVLGKIIITETNYAKKEHLEIGTSPYKQEDIIDVIQLPQVYRMPKE